MTREVLKPWGKEFRVYMDDAMDIWLMCFNKGESSSYHYHPNKDKWLLVVEGEAALIKDNQYHPAKRGDTQFIPRGVPHRQVAMTEAKILECEWPPNKLDIVRLVDRYGREGKEYEDQNANSK